MEPNVNLLGRRPSTPDARDFTVDMVRSASPLELAYQRLLVARGANAAVKDWAGELMAALGYPLPPTPLPPTPADVDIVWPLGDAVLNQGDLPHCGGAGGCHWLNLEPVIGHYREPDLHALYYEAVAIGGFPGTEDGVESRWVAQALQARGRLDTYAFAKTVDEVREWVRTRGPVMMGTDWTCALPDTRVLTTDLDWLPVEKVEPGQRVIGFDEHAGRTARYREAIVVANPAVVQPSYEVVTDKGTINVSANHRFVSMRAKEARAWRTPSGLLPGDRLAYMGKPWDRDESWEGGWLAGFYDGEGHLSGYETTRRRNANVLVCSQNPGATADRALAILRAKGFDYTIRSDPSTGVLKWHLRGPNVKLRFLGSIRPSRLLATAERAWKGHCTFNNAASAAVVERVRYLGDELVYAVGTTTRTLVTDGYLSHNSDMFNPGADGVVHPTGGMAGGHFWVICGDLPGEQRVLCLNSWDDSWGLGGYFKVSYLDLGDLLAGLYYPGDAIVSPELAH